MWASKELQLPIYINWLLLTSMEPKAPSKSVISSLNKHSAQTSGVTYISFVKILPSLNASQYLNMS